MKGVKLVTTTEALEISENLWRVEIRVQYGISRDGEIWEVEEIYSVGENKDLEIAFNIANIKLNEKLNMPIESLLKSKKSDFVM